VLDLLRLSVLPPFQLQLEKEERPGLLMSDLEEEESQLLDEEILRPVSPSKYKVQAKKNFISVYQEMMQGREEAKRMEAEEKQREAALQYELVSSAALKCAETLFKLVHCVLCRKIQSHRKLILSTVSASTVGC